MSLTYEQIWLIVTNIVWPVVVYLAARRGVKLPLLNGGAKPSPGQPSVAPALPVAVPDVIFPARPALNAEARQALGGWLSGRMAELLDKLEEKP